MKKLWAFLSILLFVTTVLGYLWWGRFQYHHKFYLLLTYIVGLALIAGSHWYFSDQWKTLGMSRDNWKRAVGAWGLLTLVGWIILLLAGLRWGEFSAVAGAGIGFYGIWALLQQHVLQNFLRLRLQELFSPQDERHRNRPFTCLLVSSISAGAFALLHLPNLTLSMVTFAAAFGWCLLFFYVPSLFGAWFSHVVLGSTLLFFFKYGALGPFQGGPPYFRYESYGDGVQVAGGYDSSGRPFIATVPGPDLSAKSRVRVFDVQGSLLSEWTAFPDLGYSGRIAVGDVGFKAGDEIIVLPGPGKGNPALVRIYNTAGELIKEFLAKDMPSTYGAYPAVVCSEIYLAQGPGPGSPQLLSRYNADGQRIAGRDFSEELDLVNGLRALPIAEPCPAEEFPRLLLYGSGVAVNTSGFWLVDAGNTSFQETFGTTYGLNMTTVQLGQSVGVAVAPGPLVGYPPWIKVFSLSGEWKQLYDFVPYSDRETAGTNIAALDIDADGVDELILGEGAAPGRPPVVRLVSLQGRVLSQWRAYD